MKTGRNELCPCGSGKKHKHCCMEQPSTPVEDKLREIMAMNPHLGIEELRAVIQQGIVQENQRELNAFHGLSPVQMHNWLYAPLSELDGVSIQTPTDLTHSPVMRYLELILEQAMQEGGSFKATAKGNLPTKLVKQANALLPELPQAAFYSEMEWHDFAGSNEDKFDALHYTRVVANLAGILYFRSGRIHIKKAAQKQYQTQGLHAFFLPMLEAAVKDYNWGYMDHWPDDINISTFWLFMIWRLQSHRSVDTLTDEVLEAFTPIVTFMPDSDYFSPQQQLNAIIDSRFVERFLQFWGFITVDPKRFDGRERLPRMVNIQPLFTQTFKFDVVGKTG